VSVCSVAEENSASLSKKQVKVLIATAKTPAEHRRIAAYYQHQALDLRNKAREHEEMAQMYRKNPLSFEGKFPYGSVGFSHCHEFAELYTRQAKEAEALASFHEEMAKAAESK
jgi:hypothetical protein